MLKNISIALFLCCLFSLQVKGENKNTPYSFHQLTINDGLSHADANAIVQDSKGYIWIGTYSGLDRYDGFRLKSFYNDLSYINKSYLNRIADISIDKSGMLWLATFSGIQLFNPYSESYTPVKITNETNKENKHEIKKILCTTNNRLFIIDNRQKISMYKIQDSNTLSREAFSLDAHCYSFFKDNQHNIWISSDKGIWKLNSQNKLIHLSIPQLNNQIDYVFINQHQNLLVGGKENIVYFTCKTDTINNHDNYKLLNGIDIPLASSSGTITNITESALNDYWVSTLKGLFHIKRNENKFLTEAIYAGDYPTSLNSDYINGLLIDKSNNLFIASYGAGISILDLNKKPFHIIQRVPLTTNTLSEKIVRVIIEDGDNLWIGTNSMGINRFNLQTEQFTTYDVHNGLRSNSIRAMAIDKSNTLWIGHTKGLDILHSGFTKHIGFTNGNIATSFPDVEVSSIAVDCLNQIWVGTWFNGLFRVYKDTKGNYQTEALKLSKPDYPAFTPERIITVYADPKKPEIFFSSGEKLTRIFLNKDGSINKTIIYQANDNKQHSLSSNFICSIERENDSILWVGCIGGGLNRMKLLDNGDYEAQNFFEKGGLKLKDVECLQKDSQGNIWLAGNGIVKYDPQNNVFKSYTIDNTYTNSYKVGASCKGKSGNIYFGGINGLVYFNTKEIIENKFLASPEISVITVNNQLIETSKAENKNILPESITYLEQIQLNYNQNNFTLFFSPLHYTYPLNCKFRYKLNNYDKTWITTEGNYPYASYANLPYGNYTFELQAANNDGVWNKEIKTLKIRITPPWWLSLPAKIVYGIFILLSLIIIYYYLLRWVGLKKQLEYKDLEEKKNEEMHQMQLQFFTNISHEFRTPLTLILGTIEQMEPNKTERWNKEAIGVLSQNARRLMKLVNELMDFRKAETGSFHLIVQEKYITNFLEMITNEFRSLAQAHEIYFSVYMDKQYEKVWFDPQLTEKIFLNLLNNAFKYTPNNGNIEVKILSEIKNYIPTFANSYTINSEYNGEKYFYICIKDNGIGISKDSIEKVFNRYYQVEDSTYDPHLGSGVGLALVKSLLLLHKGKLTIYSERDKGTEFIVGIPCGNNDYQDYEKDSNLQIPAILTEQISVHDEIKKTESVASLPNKTQINILLVEDNDDVRHFLCNSLNKNYSIREAINGVDALVKIEKEKPDLIISDLMMPQMDGNKLCLRLKENTETSTIPFIMLTAKDTVDAKIEGLECGANAYLCKPISIRLLLSTIQNLLNQQKRIKEHLSSNYLSTAIDDTMQMKDKEFYDQLIQVIELNISNIDLDVDLISKELNLSRTKLYQRVKDITGKPIMELVRSVRLRKATQIMAEEDISIQEIIIRIGIQSQSYFTSSFKKEFGKTPSQFLKELKGGVI